MPGSCAHVCPRTVGIAKPSGAASDSAAEAGRPERASDRRRIGPASGADWPGARRGNGICRADPSAGRAVAPPDGTAAASDAGDRRARGTTAAAARGRDGAVDVLPESDVVLRRPRAGVDGGARAAGTRAGAGEVAATVPRARAAGASPRERAGVAAGAPEDAPGGPPESRTVASSRRAAARFDRLRSSRR